METKGLISVIIPVYNVEKYLRECVESVLKQTYQNFEIILVDDGSKDSSGDICDEYAEKDTRIRVIHKGNGGASAARNAGLKEAAGEFVYFLDSDDYIQEETFSTLTAVSCKEQADIVFFEAVCFNENGATNQGNYRYRNKYGCGEGKWILSELIVNKEFHVSVPLLFLRKDLLETTGQRFEEKIMYEDMIYTFELMHAAQKIVHCDQTFYHRRYRSMSVMTAPKTEHNFKSALTVYDELIGYMEKKGIQSEEASKAYITRWALNTIDLYTGLPRDIRKKHREEYRSLIASVREHDAFGSGLLRYRCFGKFPWMIYKVFEKLTGK